MRSTILIFLILSLITISFVLGEHNTGGPDTSTTDEDVAGGDAAAPGEDLGGESSVSSASKIEPYVGILIPIMCAAWFCK